jgi:hypothetical protein
VQLLDAGQDEQERVLRGMDALLLELVLQVTLRTPTPTCSAVHVTLRRPCSRRSFPRAPLCFVRSRAPLWHSLLTEQQQLQLRLPLQQLVLPPAATTNRRVFAHSPPEPLQSRAPHRPMRAQAAPQRRKHFSRKRSPREKRWRRRV